MQLVGLAEQPHTQQLRTARDSLNYRCEVLQPAGVERKKGYGKIIEGYQK